MLEPMTLERFRLLADGYGGVVGRWPDADRAEGFRLAASQEGGMILEEATALDMALDDWRTASVSDGLAARLAASLPATAASAVHRMRLWWSAVGIAASLTGVIAGSACAAVLLPAPVVADGATSFGSFGNADDIP